MGTFWEEAEQVDRFARREPDVRLLGLLDSFRHPDRTRVLDLGCAGGRNTVVLAERGFDVYAVDTSSAMVKRTRERVAAVLSPEEAARRVRVARMEDLREFASGFFHLVVALGVYHNAGSARRWEEAIGETVRVMAAGGWLLVANFSPRSDPTGDGVHQVEGERHVYTGFKSGPLYLLEADELDAEMRRHNLEPVVPTETVKAQRDSGYRVTVNALYRKQHD